ncbi:hypothetical protein HanXRQr2_Chr04g0190781 [Helianthus annuus]|uniref:Uncharacterized protein n=1 Tax=Helianthus annuus TaxID=4232 RepID=A0A9K3JC26_HELAN|nr:hypothetical protein HanXRQr2_Chr04g0190781 [Helianthus annuus]KAJ0591198.1 hypothetical protein HanIR_Chr04g0205701 [Helianthus annuus]KAJ0933393.1 hypothetical protein HanPSC8_Chr04g0184281 [Helianthus annuus]
MNHVHHPYKRQLTMIPSKQQHSRGFSVIDKDFRVSVFEFIKEPSLLFLQAKYVDPFEFGNFVTYGNKI